MACLCCKNNIGMNLYADSRWATWNGQNPVESAQDCHYPCAGTWPATFDPLLALPCQQQGGGPCCPYSCPLGDEENYEYFNPQAFAHPMCMYRRTPTVSDKLQWLECSYAKAGCEEEWTQFSHSSSLDVVGVSSGEIGERCDARDPADASLWNVSNPGVPGFARCTPGGACCAIAGVCVQQKDEVTCAYSTGWAYQHLDQYRYKWFPGTCCGIGSSGPSGVCTAAAKEQYGSIPDCFRRCCRSDGTCYEAWACEPQDFPSPATSCFPNPCNNTGCMMCDWCCNMRPSDCVGRGGQVQATACAQIAKPWYTQPNCYDAELHPATIARDSGYAYPETANLEKLFGGSQCFAACLRDRGDTRINTAGYAAPEFCNRWCSCLTDQTNATFAPCRSQGGCIETTRGNMRINSAGYATSDMAYRGPGAGKPNPCNN